LDVATGQLRTAFPDQSLPQIAEILHQLENVKALQAQETTARTTLITLFETSDLRAEMARLDALDPAALRADSEMLQTAVDAQQQVTQRAFADLITAQRDRDSVGSDARAAQLDEDHQTLGLQIIAEANDFLARQAAILAVDSALRTYRDLHRSSMMERAGAAFQVLTLGRYSGLATQPSSGGDVLIVKEKTGVTKMVDSLSTGTADQLYLALRVAGYQELADQRPMVPFIADDILQSFDDARAIAAFGLLAQMAQRGQVIYLTHHAHLCSIARSACPDVQVHDLHRL
jgi:uncharacterized protein YhaN